MKTFYVAFFSGFNPKATLLTLKNFPGHWCSLARICTLQLFGLMAHWGHRCATPDRLMRGGSPGDGRRRGGQDSVLGMEKSSSGIRPAARGLCPSSCYWKSLNLRVLICKLEKIQEQGGYGSRPESSWKARLQGATRVLVFSPRTARWRDRPAVPVNDPDPEETGSQLHQAPPSDAQQS